MQTNVIYNGNSATLLREKVDSDSVHLTVTSPPYDNLKDYGEHKFGFDEFCVISSELYRVTVPGGVVVWVVDNSTDSDGSETTTAEEQKIFFRKIGFSVHDTMIYLKTGMSKASTNRYHQVFEYMYVFSKGKPRTFHPLKDRKNKYVGRLGGNAVGGKSNRGEYGMRFNVWQYANGKNHTARWNDAALNHPAPFPESLARDHILTWSNPGDIVLDPFAGSGTTLKAAKLLSREYIGMEIVPAFVGLIDERLSQAAHLFSVSDAVLLEGGKQ